MFNWLDRLVELLVSNVFGIAMETRLGSSIHFFIYDTVKILILLTLIVFIMSFIQSFFPPEKVKKALGRFKGISGNIVASLLGVVSPFCSCSSVPIFIGLVESGVPLGVTFSFLITSPIVNEAAFAILLSLFGWKVTAIYVLSGITIGVIGGLIIGKLKMEDEVIRFDTNGSLEVEEEEITMKARLAESWEKAFAIIKKIWIYLIIGIGIGALIHGYVPEDLLSKYASKDNPLAVIVGVIFGVPLYANAMATIPIAQALIGKGVALGTAMSFMMAVVALSLPEMILLKQVMKKKLMAVFIAITTVGIILVGYLFNYLEVFLT